MIKNDNFPDYVPETGDGDDVEILEVVGVEDEAGAAAPIPASGTDDDPEDNAEEYLIDFDAPEKDSLVPGNESVAHGDPDAGDNGGDGDTDHERLLRLRADYANLRRRIDREREEFELRANCELVSQLLPVVDNLERALAANSDAGDEGPLREGLVMIHRQLTGELRDAGLEPIETVGQHFDPNLHDAVATEAGSDQPANTIVEEMQRGYLFQNRVLRPAMVKVSTGNGASGEDA